MSPAASSQGMQEALGQTVVVEIRSAAAARSARCGCRDRRPTARSSCSATTARIAGASRSYKTPPYDAVKDFYAARLGGRIAARADRAAEFPGQYAAGVHSLRESPSKRDAVRLGGRRLRLARELRPAQRHARRQRHPRALPRPRAGDAGPDRRPRALHFPSSVSTSKPQTEIDSLVKQTPHHGRAALAGAEGHSHRERARLGFRRADLAGPVPRQGHARPGAAPAQPGRSSKALDLPSLRGRFEPIGEEIPAPERRTPEYFSKFVAGEINRWSGPIKASGVTVE